LQVLIDKLDFYLINDQQGVYVPELQLSLTPSKASFTITRSKAIVSLNISFALLFHNSEIQIWEPLIEQAAISLYVSLNKESSPKLHVVLDAGQDD